MKLRTTDVPFRDWPWHAVGGGAGPAHPLGTAVTRLLPAWISFHRRGGAWRLVCKACGLVQEFDRFWLASEAAHDHAAEHLAELDSRVSAS